MKNKYEVLGFYRTGPRSPFIGHLLLGRYRTLVIAKTIALLFRFFNRPWGATKIVVVKKAPVITINTESNNYETYN